MNGWTDERMNSNGKTRKWRNQNEMNDWLMTANCWWVYGDNDATAVHWMPVSNERMNAKGRDCGRDGVFLVWTSVVVKIWIRDRGSLSGTAPKRHGRRVGRRPAKSKIERACDLQIGSPSDSKSRLSANDISPKIISNVMTVHTYHTVINEFITPWLHKLRVLKLN